MLLKSVISPPRPLLEEVDVRDMLVKLLVGAVEQVSQQDRLIHWN